jgi:hypothetical protein
MYLLNDLSSIEYKLAATGFQNGHADSGCVASSPLVVLRDALDAVDPSYRRCCLEGCRAEQAKRPVGILPSVLMFSAPSPRLQRSCQLRSELVGVVATVAWADFDHEHGNQANTTSPPAGNLNLA